MAGLRLEPARSKAFLAAIEMCWTRLYRLAYAWSRDPDIASDLAQETVFKALKTDGQLPDAKDMDAWLFRILSNCWHDHFRRHREMDNIEDLPLSHNESPDRENDRAEVLSQVRHAIAHLNEEQRQVFTLVAVEGMRYAEVATILQIPVGTVMSRLSRARQSLRKRLKDLDPGMASSTATVRSIK